MNKMPLRFALPALLAAAVLGAAGDAPAADGDRAADDAGVTYLDVRDGAAAEAVAEARTEEDQPAGTVRAAARLLRAQGALATLELDATTGTVRNLADLAGTLTGSSDDGPVQVAKDYVRAHLTALGLTSADLATLRFDAASTSNDGVTHVRWIQVVEGIPAFDNGLTVDVDRAGRVLGVGGSPLHSADPNVTSPRLSATAALRAFMSRVGSEGAVPADDGSSGPRQEAAFSDGSSAELVQFDVNGRLRLAWRIRHRASTTEHYDAVIDAVSGRLLHRANFVKFAVDVKVFPHYPGAAQGGTQITRDIDRFLFSPTALEGPYARAFSDVNDNNAPDGGETVNPGAAGIGGTTFDARFATNAAGGCGATGPKCSWDFGAPTSWGFNRVQNTVQAFWFVNRFRDHLASPAIDFTQARGGFECIPPSCSDAGDDRVIVQSDDGAATAADGGPDDDHLNNANMSTPPDGGSPIMQMYLFYSSGPGGAFRDVNGGDSAEIAYHEYTHGLSSRLVVDSSGAGALNSPQAAAMGEGWSDWYAMDFLARPDTDNAGEVYVPDTASPGEIDLGDYTDATPNRIRSQPLDCPTGIDSSACPGDGTAGSGGYTYGDFGRVCGCGPEEHADGEIWAETLWDLRTRLIADLGGVALGSDKAEQLITGAMRLSPPEPSFLDMRNAMLLEANALGNPANPTTMQTVDLQDAIWDVFTARGMGFFAGTQNGSDTAPAESFAPRPAPGGATGTVAGIVTDALTGAPVPAVRISLGGQASADASNVFVGTTGTDGRYSLGPVPQGTYGKVFVGGGGGYDPKVITDLDVASEQATLNASVVRNWAAMAGGGSISSASDASGDSAGCGPSALINQSQRAGWSPWNPATARSDFPADLARTAPTATIALPRPVDITAFGADPAATCGDDETAAARKFTIETSRDGTTFTMAVDGTGTDAFVPADAGTLKTLTPVVGSGSAVRFVRITLLSPQDACSGCSGRDFIDFSELAVRGNGIPTGSLAVPATGTAGEAVTLDASSFTDDGSLTGFAWDFDGDGSFDRTTTTATTSFAYAAAGSYLPRVQVTDNTSGTSSATSAISIAAPAAAVVVPVKPRITFPRQSANRATFRVTCEAACAGTATLKVARRLARRLGLRTRTIGTARFALKPGTATVLVPIQRLVLLKFRNRRIRAAVMPLTARVTDTRGLVTKLARTPRIRISLR